jgi:hypothetical protein
MVHCRAQIEPLLPRGVSTTTWTSPPPVEGGKVMTFQHGEVPRELGVRRSAESADLTSQDKPLAVRGCHQGRMLEYGLRFLAGGSRFCVRGA